MTKTVDLPSYGQTQACLDRLQLVLSAAEVHGLFTGLLCANKVITFSQCLAFLEQESSAAEFIVAEPDKILLRNLFQGSRHNLFQAVEELMILLMPGDDMPLLIRTDALGDWSHGFISGLGLSGCYINHESDEECGEALRDLAQIAKITITGGYGEEEEHAFLQILDYVTIAVLLIYRSLQYTAESIEPMTETLH